MEETKGIRTELDKLENLIKEKNKRIVVLKEENRQLMKKLLAFKKAVEGIDG